MRVVVTARTLVRVEAARAVAEMVVVGRVPDVRVAVEMVVDDWRRRGCGAPLAAAARGEVRGDGGSGDDGGEDGGGGRVAFRVDRMEMRAVVARVAVGGWRWRGWWR